MAGAWLGAGFGTVPRVQVSNSQRSPVVRRAGAFAAFAQYRGPGLLPLLQ